MKRIVAACVAALFVSGTSGVAAAAETPDGAWWSYCNIQVGTGSSRASYFSRLFQGRVNHTLEDTRSFTSSPMNDSNVRERLTKTFEAQGFLTHPTDSRCWTMPTRDYLETTMLPDTYDRHNDGRPIYEFDFDPMTGAVSGVHPMAAPSRHRATAPAPPRAPSNGPGLIISGGDTPADRAERIRQEDRNEAMRVAEIKRKEAQVQDHARRLVEEKAAMEAWKRRPKAPPCGGTTGRGCPASRQ